MTKEIDWPVIFARLAKEMSVVEISKLTGLSQSAIHKYKSERLGISPEHDKYVKAMLLYLSQTDADIPVVGQYFEDYEEA